MTITIPSWSLTDRMKKAREYRKLSQQQMADEMTAAGIEAKRSTVQAWESGAHQPSHRGVRMSAVLQKWAEITDVDHAWLATGQGSTTSSWGDVVADLRLDHAA